MYTDDRVIRRIANGEEDLQNNNEYNRYNGEIFEGKLMS